MFPAVDPYEEMSPVDLSGTPYSRVPLLTFDWPLQACISKRVGGMFSLAAYKGVLLQLSVQLRLCLVRPRPNHCQMVARVLASGAIYEACGRLEGARGKIHLTRLCFVV